MKSFLHSRALGCPVGVAIPVQEQHHMLRALRISLSCSVYVFSFVPLSQWGRRTSLVSRCSTMLILQSDIQSTMVAKWIHLSAICKVCNQLKCIHPCSTACSPFMWVVWGQSISTQRSIYQTHVFGLWGEVRVPERETIQTWNLSARRQQHASRIWNCIFVFYLVWWGCSLTRCEHIVSSVTYQK